VRRALLVIVCASLGYAKVGWAQSTRVHVVLEGAAAVGAEVFVDGQLRGKTDQAGNVDVPQGLVQNGTTKLSARLQVYEVPAFLPGYGDAASPNGWMMRVYVTNILIDNSGKVNRFVVADRTATQQLVLQRDNVLFGLQLLVSADWDMSQSDFIRLMETFQVASRFLWNATDGQFVFEQIKIADQAKDWSNSMYHLYADNTPRAVTTAGGYLAQNAIGVLVGSSVTIAWRDPMIHIQGSDPWWDAGNPRTLVHEFGHLGFALMDEYSDQLSDTCTVRRTSDTSGPFAPGGEKAACIMDDHFSSNKFCSDEGPNSHNYTSKQPDDCWAGIRGGYSDPSSARWTLKTPVTRDAIVGTLLGPSGTKTDAFPLEWNTKFVVTNVDWSAPLCKPFLQPVTMADGSPATRSTIKLLYTSIDPSQHTWISEGKTLSDGNLAIISAHQGDTVMTQVAFRALPTCPMGTWPQGTIGVSSDDPDGDGIPDTFDACPSRFNPFDLDGTGFVSQPTTCACSTDTDCGGGLACAANPGGSGMRCIVPVCRTDAECGAGRRCSGDGASAACVDRGTACTSNAQCNVGHCDVGDGTSKTGFCVPNTQAGQPGDICSDNNQCASGNCGGLAPKPGGGWQVGQCAASAQKPLGETCFTNAQCQSAYCDAGDGTSKTNRCMPNHNGQTGQICSHDNQCSSLNCNGLSNVGALVPGMCAPKRALGGACTANTQCASTYCDGGDGTSKTWRCMPNRDGQDGDICSDDRQCVSLNCLGLTQANGAWVPGVCSSKKALGASCGANNQCASSYCDAGDGTSKTNRCMPNRDGRNGDICSDDRQCASLVCAGLTTNSSNQWVPGACASKKALGDSCSQNYQCASGYCDAGDGTSKTNRCMPYGNGRSGDICSHDNQCTSRRCVGLHAQGNAWIPGNCQ
jgi:hypothetical protein